MPMESAAHSKFEAAAKDEDKNRMKKGVACSHPFLFQINKNLHSVCSKPFTKTKFCLKWNYV